MNRRGRLRQRVNPKRRIARLSASEKEKLSWLASKACYRGNPVHKRNPGDFRLDPPARPRPDKSLCDEAGVTCREIAQGLLEEGMRRGLVDGFVKPKGFPKHVWAVAGDVVFEAVLDNRETGYYHGYPLPPHDPFVRKVLEAWPERGAEKNR